MTATDAPEAKHRPSQAIESLEGRLQTLEQHLSVRSKDDRARPAPERLQRLHRDIQTLANQSEAAADLLELYRKHRTDLAFPPSSDQFGAPSSSEKLAIVSSCAASFPSTVSQLTSLESLSIPPSESLVALTGLNPQVAKLALLQGRQMEELAELRSRTAELLQRWHAVSVLSVGNCWAEWEERLLRIEAAVRQAEAASKPEP